MGTNWNEEGNLECLATDNVFNKNEVVEKKKLVLKSITSFSLHKKWSFPLRVYWRNPQEKTSVFLPWLGTASKKEDLNPVRPITHISVLKTWIQRMITVKYFVEIIIQFEKTMNPM